VPWSPAVPAEVVPAVPAEVVPAVPWDVSPAVPAEVVPAVPCAVVPAVPCAVVPAVPVWFGMLRRGLVVHATIPTMAKQDIAISVFFMEPIS
jgi:hypothetical protein